MIRVLHVLSVPAAGGAETYVRDLAKAQKALGVEVHIAFLGSAGELDLDPVFEKVYLSQLDEFGIPYFFIGNDCRRNPLKGMWLVARYCRQKSITHYHAHLVYGLIFGAFLCIPRFFTEHHEHVRGPGFLRRALNCFVEAYVAISSKCAVTLEQVVRRPVNIIYNGIDNSRMEVNSRQEPPLGAFRILSVGRVVPQKNYSLLIEALARLEALINHDFEAEIAGDGTVEAIAALEAQAAAAGIGHRVRFLGNRTDVTKLMASSDLLIMSSASEGLPIVLLEAISAHLPFVATDVGGCSEVAEITGAGIVVPPGDANALAEAIRTLFTDHAKRNAMRVAAATKAEHFSIEHSAKAHLVLYYKAVKT